MVLNVLTKTANLLILFDNILIDIFLIGLPCFNSVFQGYGLQYASVHVIALSYFQYWCTNWNMDRLLLIRRADFQQVLHIYKEKVKQNFLRWLGYGPYMEVESIIKLFIPGDFQVNSISLGSSLGINIVK